MVTSIAYDAVYIIIHDGQFLTGDRYYTANVHILLHFAHSVRNIEPLW